MADPKEGESFFRKVVRFVANPATDWNDINTNRPDEVQDLERSELKAMVLRKKQNDFVRKREFDMLRKLRREGLSPEQLAALGGSSKVDDSEVRSGGESSGGARADAGVKAKIDEIEQQMVGEGASSHAPLGRRSTSADTLRRERAMSNSRAADFYSAPTQPIPLNGSATRAAEATTTPSGATDLPPLQMPQRTPERSSPISARGNLDTGTAPLRDGRRAGAGTSSGVGVATSMANNATSRAGTGATTGIGSLALPPLSRPMSDLTPLPPAPPRPPLPQVDMRFGNDSPFDVEVSEVVHDPDLDEAVIAFANADFNHCESALEQQRRPGGARHQHGETWLVLFDLYRATGQQAKFESLALDYANQFHRSAPQWFSLPKLVADATVEEQPDTRGIKGEVGWVSPLVLDNDGVAKLRSATLQLPLPWVLDWAGLQRVEPEAAAQLTTLMRQWAPQRIDMRWMSADQLLNTLQEAAPTGARDADPAYWMARLEALRLANRPDQFDETAIDYCVTYEMSPPSWESAQCQVRALSGSSGTLPPPLSIVGEPSSSFLESRIEEGQPTEMTTVELSGQLAGDISAVLERIDGKLGEATLVQVSCTRLIRVDFIAAGDLLNWVLAKHSENRSVTFADAHRLVALFFGAMGINEHARVQVPRH